ncbi:MAG: SpoVG family protein [Planctomycetales bacterium]|nr:SpoVG family protein [Planctomycetales bacterium]
MEITEVRVKLMEDPNERLQAFCSITFDDCFVVRDLKIIDGTNGLFVAMPSRKLTARCPKCGCKNHSRSNYCNQCGLKMAGDRAVLDESGRAKLYADIAHPINSQCRETIQQRIIQAYHEEVEKSKLPDYRSTYDDFDAEDREAIAVEETATATPHSRDEASKTRTDSAHAATEQPHMPAVSGPVTEFPRDANSANSRAQSGPHEKSGPHTKPSHGKSEQPTRRSKPSDGFGHGIL